MTAQLDDEIDLLYAGPLDRFVSERKALAQKLKQAGDGDGAAEVASLRKPTVVAWTVNQLARENRREVDLLLDAGKRIIDAQQASIAEGGRAGIDAARASLRKAVADLTAAAHCLLGKQASQTTLTRVAETLRSAATEAEGRELLARGRLTVQLSDTGWETVSALSPRESSRPAKKTGGAHRGALKAAREKVRREQAARSAALTLLDKAVREEARVRGQLRAAEAAVEEARADIAAIEQRLEEAEQQLGELADR